MLATTLSAKVTYVVFAYYASNAIKVVIIEIKRENNRGRALGGLGPKDEPGFTEKERKH